MKKIITLLFLVFYFDGKAQYTKLLDFGGTVSGANPYGDLISDGTFLYGMTKGNGSAGSYGDIFKIMPNGSGYAEVLYFNATNGSAPQGSLMYDGTYLYGMTSLGGVNGEGNIFKIKPDGTGYTLILSFNETNGENPLGSLISDGTFLYGMTSIGGTSTNCSSGCGTTFKIMSDGSGYVDLLNFNITNGSHPYAALVSDGTFLYGMTEVSALNSLGNIFKLMPDGTGLTTLLNFSGIANGSHPYGSLMYDGTYLYGMTSLGGANGYGTIFKIKPDGTGDTILFSFNDTNGSTPKGSLISDGTFLYGMTSTGGSSTICGTNGCGVLFKIKPDGTGYTILYNFSGTSSTDGANPLGSLFYDGISCLYGMTESGGNYGNGIVFSYCLNTVGIKLVAESSNNQVNIYPNPASTSFQVVWTGNNKQATMNMYDVNGRLVLSQTINGRTSIDVGILNEGVYNISIISNEGVVNKRLVIVR